ncbi:MAG: T9SS type A sorting domain-containing protein, partial [Bacteroidetes bacterium SB0668_bin_1]|nr:T9SS type A sorting domain-containing protein [Bacteroidetes bacterium SB0668_bin_1]
PEEVSLGQNYPNPFNPETTIRYALPWAGNVRLAVYDLLGHEVAVLVDESKPAGHHTTRFDAGDLPSGAYVYRLQAQGRIMGQVMMLVK